MITRRVSVSIDHSAIAHNFQCIRQLAGHAEVYCAVKANAYGHGALSTALALQPLMTNSDGFCVATPMEALELREQGVTQSLLVLQGALTATECDTLAEQSVQCVVHDESQCELLMHRKSRHPIAVWVKVDTGMGRIGFAPSMLASVLRRLSGCAGVRVKGILSHLACADQPGHPHTAAQLATFRQIAIEHRNYRYSLANSAALLAWTDSLFDRVRPGIMLYGANPITSNEVVGTSRPPLRPAMRVAAPLIAIKQLRGGDGIGYGQTFRCPSAMTVGVVAIGYRDGFPRDTKGATVSIGGHRADVLGRTSMDSIIVNLCGIDTAVGSTAVIIGPEAPVELLASSAGTISYDLLCRFGQ